MRLISLKRWQLLMLRNTWRQGGRERLKPLGQLVGLAAFAGFVYWGSLSLFGSVRDAAVGGPPGLLPTLQANLLSSISLGMLIVLLVTGLRAINDVLFQAADLPFLLTQPVAARTIFASKFIDSYLVSLALCAPIALSAWLAFGVVSEVPWLYYPLMLLVGLLGVLLYHNIVVLLLLLIMRFVPGQTMKQIFVVLSGLGAVSIVLVSQVLASRLVQESLQDPIVLFQSVGQWGLGGIGWLPHVWMTKAVLLPLAIFSYSIAGSLLPLVLVTVAATALTIGLAERLYAKGWAAGTEATRGSASRRTHGVTYRWPRGPFWAVLRKDFLGFRRDPLVWYHFVVGAIVVGFFYFNLSGGGSGGSAGSGGGPMVMLMPVLMAAVSSTQLGGVGISREGANWWLVRTLVAQPGALYWSKFVSAIVPSLVFVSGAALASEYLTSLSIYPLNTTLGLMWIMTFGIAAFTLLLDILAPDFNLRIEFGVGRKGSAGTGKLSVAMFAVMLYIGAMFLAFMLPHIWRDASWMPKLDSAGMHTLSFVVLAVWAGGTGVLSYMWGTKRLRRLLAHGE